jgi:hypothetical protein
MGFIHEGLPNATPIFTVAVAAGGVHRIIGTETIAGSMAGRHGAVLFLWNAQETRKPRQQVAARCVPAHAIAGAPNSGMWRLLDNLGLNPACKPNEHDVRPSLSGHCQA